MNMMIDRAVEALLDILRDAGPRGLQLETAKMSLRSRLGTQSDTDTTRLVQQAIQHALDNWLIDKVIDYPLNSEGKEVGQLTWFLCPLSEEESDFLKNLPNIEKAVLKILRERETEYGLGTMSEEDLLLRLEALGFETDYVPTIEDRVSDFYEPENDELIAWYYLVPQFERTPEFKKTMKELEELSLRKELRYERES